MLEANAMDFDDLLVRTVNLLELFEDVRDRYRERFRWVLVDEYQDTNRAQYRLLQLLAGEHGNLTVVGDDDQSIYGFRGADIRNILEFERRLPGRRRGQARAELPLDRDDPRRRQRGHRPQPRPHRQAPLDRPRRGRAVHVAELDDEHAEARYVAGEIERADRPGRAGRDEIAVFYRINAQSRVLEDTLVRFELPYQVIGGTKFYERAEIKDAVAYLQLLANPADAVSLRADRQLAAARDRRHHPGAAALARQHDRADDLGRRARGRAGPGARRRGDQGRSPGSPS